MNNMKTTKTLALLLLAAAVGNSALAQTAITLPPNRAYTFTGTAASGSGTLSYQWYRNSVAIGGATSQNYSMPANLANGIGVEFKRGTTSSTCPNQVIYSNIYYVTFCGIIVGQTCWASENTFGNNTFGSRPDEYSPFFQWNKTTAWASTGSISGWSSAVDNSPTWTNNTCPTGWRVPTQQELIALHNIIPAGGTWAAANAKGNAVAGRFYGPNSASCTLPNNMNGCIFLPAVGYRIYNAGTLNNQDSHGYYWSATQYVSNGAYILYFNSGGSYPSIDDIDYYQKSYGMSIRCVQ